MIATERWYLTEDGRSVREGDPDARRLIVAAGAEIADALARQYGLLPSTKASYEAVVEPEIEAQLVEDAPENKALEMPAPARRSRKVRRQR